MTVGVANLSFYCDKQLLMAFRTISEKFIRLRNKEMFILNLNHPSIIRNK